MFLSVLLRVSRKPRTRGWLEVNISKDCPKLTQEDVTRYGEIYEHVRDFTNVWNTQQAWLIGKAEHERQLEELRQKIKYCCQHSDGSKDFL